MSYPGRWGKPWLFWQAWWRASRCTSPRLPAWPRWCWSSTPATWLGPAQSGYLSALPEQTINRAPLIMTHSLLACVILKSGGFSETSPNHPVLNHEYWPANNMWKHRNINKLQFNLKINLKKWPFQSMIMFKYCAEYENQFFAAGTKYFMMAFSQRANGIWISQDSNLTSFQSISYRMSIHRFETHAWAHLLINKLAIYDICRFLLSRVWKK